MIKYLVTGGCGFIGSHVVDTLTAQGHQVRVLDDLSNSTPRYLPAGAELIPHSITDEEKVNEAIEGVDGIFHLAAMISVVDSVSHWYRSHEVNCAATIRLLEQAKGIPFIFASSAAIYGDSPVLPHREGAIPLPLSPYAADKLTCEMHARLAWELHRTPSACFRFFNVYGPRQNPSSPYSGVISKFANLIPNGKEVTIYGEGTQTRDFIYVKDVADTLVKTMSKLTHGASIYNLCTGMETSINTLADLIGKMTGAPVHKRYAPARIGEIQKSLGDPTFAQHTLGLKAPTSLQLGLQGLLDAERLAAAPLDLRRLREEVCSHKPDRQKREPEPV